MEENRQTRSEQEIAKRDWVREGRCVLQHVTIQFCKIDFSNKKISKKKCHFSVDFSHFRLISSHILIEARGKEGWIKGTRDKDRKWGERRKEEARRKKRAKEERMQDKRMKGERREKRQKEKGSSKGRWMHQKQLVRIKTCVLMRTGTMKWGITLPRKAVMVVTKGD